MSAFMVSGHHIDAMLTAGLDRRAYGPLRWWPQPRPNRTMNNVKELTDDTAGLVGAMLLNENRISVNDRYSEDEIEEPYLFRQVPGYSHARHALIVLKAIGCYEYQSCEHDGWDTSEAKAFCEALTHHLVGRLPGYDSAPWSIDDPLVFKV